MSAVASILELENTVLREGHVHLVVMTSHGTFTWYVAASRAPAVAESR